MDNSTGEQSVWQNIVVAINALSQNYLNVSGTANLTGITAATLVKPTAGRVCTIVVVVGGAGAGSIYDANSATATTGKIYAVTTTPGSYAVNMPVLNGIVVAPGTGQTLAVSFS